MRYFLHFLCLIFFLNGTHAQEIDTHQSLRDTALFLPLPFIDQFINNLADDSIALDIILSQDVQLDTNIQDEMIDYLIASLQEIRLNLQLKDISKLDITPFKSLPRKETKDIDLESHDPDAIYFVRYNNKLVFPLLLSQNKIQSFTLVSKGGNKAHFVTY